jgi:hypothetical protein
MRWAVGSSHPHDGIAKRQCENIDNFSTSPYTSGVRATPSIDDVIFKKASELTGVGRHEVRTILCEK